MQYPTISDSQLLAYFDRNKLLSTAENSNAKIAKSNKLHAEYRSAYLALLPADYSGHNVCPNHKYCKDSCLGVKSGRNRFAEQHAAKYYRTEYYVRFQRRFIAQLVCELENFDKLCKKQGRKAAVRLNAYSDIPYETKFPWVITDFPDITYYDYTKLLHRFDNPAMPSNYHLTYSLVGAQHGFEDIVFLTRNKGLRCSAVMTQRFFDFYFSDEADKPWVVSSVRGDFDLVNGDDHDLTFLRPAGAVLALREKGTKGAQLAFDQFKVNP